MAAKGRAFADTLLPFERLAPDCGAKRPPQDTDWWTLYFLFKDSHLNCGAKRPPRDAHLRTSYFLFERLAPDLRSQTAATGRGLADTLLPF